MQAMLILSEECMISIFSFWESDNLLCFGFTSHYIIFVWIDLKPIRSFSFWYSDFKGTVSQRHFLTARFSKVCSVSWYLQYFWTSYWQGAAMDRFAPRPVPVQHLIWLLIPSPLWVSNKRLISFEYDFTYGESC